MEVVMLPINELRLDKDQPRKYKDRDKVHSLSVSIRNKGVINPIEIDENNTIITGEMRWRAAREAGLGVIPCRVIRGISPEERFMRQIHENVHQKTMTVWDLGTSLEKCFSILGKEGEDYKSFIKREFGLKEESAKRFNDFREIGDEVRNHFSKSATTNTDSVKGLRNLPEPLLPYVLHLIEIGCPQRVVRKVRMALDKAFRNGNQRALEAIQSVDWTKYTKDNAMTRLREITPEPLDSLSEVSKEIQSTAIKLVSLLEKYPSHLFNGIEAISIAPFLVQTYSEVQKYLASADDVRVITMQKDIISKLEHGKKES